MNLATRPWLIAILLAVLALLPSSAFSVMTSEQIKATMNMYRKAAEQGNADGQVNLADCYARGVGVTKDEIEAYAYYNLAGITDEDARKDLAILEKGMSPDVRLRGQQRTKELQKEIEAKRAGK